MYFPHKKILKTLKSFHATKHFRISVADKRDQIENQLSLKDSNKTSEHSQLCSETLIGVSPSITISN